MFFAILFILVWVLLANGVEPDKFGWLMLTAVGWFAGFMDCRLIYRNKSDDADKTMPPDHDGPPQTSDSGMFSS